MSASLPVDIVIFQHLQIVGFFDLASATLILYNYVLTLGDEIEYIWRVRWTGITVLFFATRYLPFIDVGLFLTHQLLDNPSPHTCSVLDHINGFSFLTGITIADMILMVRTWAIWNRDPRTAGILIAVFLATFTPMYYFLYQFLNSVQFAQDPFPEFTGCFISKASPVLFGSYVLLMGFETGIFAMTLFKACRTTLSERDVQSTLWRTLYRDGLLFYFYLLAISVLNVLILLFAPREMANMLAFMHRTLHALVSGSIVINLRRALFDIDNETEVTHRSVARSEPVGHGFAQYKSFESDCSKWQV